MSIRSQFVMMRVALLGLAVASPFSALAQQASSDVFDAFFRFGDTAHKALFQNAQGETVDPFTGTLQIVQEDLALPGVAGLDLRLTRVYTSRIWARADLLHTTPLLPEQEVSVLGYGWQFHMGRLLNPNTSPQLSPCGNGEYPVYEGPDGSTRVFYPVASSSANRVYRSKDYWWMEQNCPILGGANDGVCIWSDSGIRYEFSNAGGNPFWVGMRPVWPVSAIVDPNGNRISVSYVPSTGAVSSITDTYYRTVTFAYSSGPDGLRLDSMDVNGAMYRYLYTTYTSAETAGAGRYALPGARRFLTEVRPPAGGSFFYRYAYAAAVANNQYALEQITSPSGGTTSYAYSSADFFTGRDNVPFAVVTQRTNGGRGIAPGTWSYSYSSPPYRCADAVPSRCSKDPLSGQPTNHNVTTITRPDGLHDAFAFWGFGAEADLEAESVSSTATYAVGLTLTVARADGAEGTWYWWDFDPVALSPVPYSAPMYGDTCGPHLLRDPAVLVPRTTRQVINRDGSAAYYVTEFLDFDAYGQPRTVMETGYLAGAVQARETHRTTSWTYFSAPTDASGSTLNMVRGRPLTQHVCIGAECFDNAWTYGGPGYLRDTATESGVQTRFGHHPSGNLQTVTNALGETLRLDDYSYGVARQIDLNGAYVIRRTPSWEGWVTSERNGRGYETRYTYDAIGRTLSVTPPGNTVQTSYEYAPNGLPDGRAILQMRAAPRAGYWLLASLDGQGRATSTEDSEGVRTQVVYDAMGNITFRSYPHEAAGGPVGDLLAYDGLGRVRVTTRGYRPDSPARTCDTDGACTVANRPFGNCVETVVQRRSSDYTSMLHCSTSYGDPQEQWLAETLQTGLWEYGYNVAGKLTAVTAPLPAGNRAYSYDARQFLVSESTGESGTTTFGRNAIGQMTSRTDARSVTGIYRHDDPLSRLTGVTWGTSDDDTRDYDEASNLRRVASSRAGALDYGHDELNRVVSAVWTFHGVPYTTTYHFDAMGCLDEITYPTGSRVSAPCDGLNRPRSLALARLGGGAEPVVESVTYHPSGQPAGYTYGNGRATTLEYDDRARLKTLTTPDVAALSYDYDGADNVVAFENSAELGSRRTMAYDGSDRLVLVDAPDLWGSTTFTYDLLGNLTSKSGPNGFMELSYDPVTNRLVRSTGPGVSLVSLTWDSPGHLAASSDGASYVYDSLGRRVAKTDAAGTTVYHYDAAGRVIAETTAEGVKLRDYVYLGSKLVAVDGCISTAPPSGCTERNWYHTDALGSVLARTDRSGAVVAAFDYEAWGERWHAPGLVAGVDGDRQYNGRVYDAETGFHDYGARLYWPEIGRFISADSYLGDPANPASLNRYSYVWNNPYKYIDPTGHSAANPCEGLGGCGGGAIGNAGSATAGGGGGGGFRPPPLRAGQAAAAEASAAQEAAALRPAVRAPTQRLLPQRAGPTAQISPSEVAGRTPQEIDARARQLGLDPKGPDPQAGRGAYVDPQTGQQRVLVHSNATPPHGHVNNPSGQRVGPDGGAVPAESPAAHLPIKMVPSH